MIFSFIQDHRKVWPVSVMCHSLDVSCAGFYAWLNRNPSDQETRRLAILDEIRVIFDQSRRCYGSPRIHAELLRRGVDCAENTVAKYMHEEGIAAKTKAKFCHTTDSNHKRPVAENLLDREFNPEKPNQRWGADITYIWTLEGWLYLAIVEDLFSRMIVGWSMAANMQSRLVVDALEMAVKNRLRKGEEGPLAHSDRGSQYASEHYQQTLLRHGITCSMSGKAQCWDNAPVESFFGTLKKELVHEARYESRKQARAEIFSYIECEYNRRRLHSSLGYKPPCEYEEEHWAKQEQARQADAAAGVGM